MTRRRTGVTLIEMMVCLSVIGLLVAIILPAVSSARESCRRATCKNNLRQLGLAAIQFHSARSSFPPGRDATKFRQHSWGTMLLPQLDQSALGYQYDVSVAWHSAKNRGVAESRLSVFRCPSTADVGNGQSDYAGNYGSTLTGLKPGFAVNQGWSSGTLVAVNIPGIRQSPISLGQITDGASNTFLVVESAGLSLEKGGGWANGHHNAAHARGPINSNRSLSIFSDHPGGAHALFCDGSIRFLSATTELRIVGSLCTRGNRELAL